jgi:hypothetical protein
VTAETTPDSPRSVNLYWLPLGAGDAPGLSAVRPAGRVGQPSADRDVLEAVGSRRDGTGEMWKSNSLTAWLLARGGHRTDDIAPPSSGRAPDRSAGLVAARRGAGAPGHRGTGAP